MNSYDQKYKRPVDFPFQSESWSITSAPWGNLCGSGDQRFQIQHRGRHRLLSWKITCVRCARRSCPLLSPFHTNLHLPLYQCNIPSRHNNTTGHQIPGLDRLLLIIASRRIFPSSHRHCLHPLSPPKYPVLC